MSYCSKCGKHIEDGDSYCSGCGAPLQNQNLNITSNVDKTSNIGLSITALVFGIVGLLAWIIPLIGVPVGVAALVLGILGIKKSNKGMSIAGLVLGGICLVLTIINGAIGAYQGYHGEAWFQKNNTNTQENVAENTFTLRDKDGNILMTGGIASASAKTVQDTTGITSYVVEIQFTDSASDQFYQITLEHIGENIGIYLNDEMISNPVVMDAISGGNCRINMESYESAEQLATLLRSTKQ